MTRSLCLAALVAVFVAASPARAQDPPAEPKLTKSDLKRYRAAMAEAVRAAKKGKHAAAIAAYDRALAVKPNDLAALTDQGWSVFVMKDYDRAEAITRRAIAADGPNKRKAAAYYNLGRILEVRADRPGAIEAYVASLEQRPTRTVREQLAKLDPARAAEMDPLKPLPMLGPFARLEDFCRTAEQKDRTPCPAPGQGAHLTNVPSPYGEVLWFQAGRDACYVAFRVGQSWFVEPKGQGCGEDDEGTWYPGDLQVSQLVPGGNPEVVFRTRWQSLEFYLNDEGYARSNTTGCDAALVACGVPAKGTPSCIYLPAGRSSNSFCSGNATEEWLWQLEPVFGGDGQVEVKGTGPLDADARLYLGRRKLRFP